jgi:hypothetical protein
MTRSATRIVGTIMGLPIGAVIAALIAGGMLFAVRPRGVDFAMWRATVFAGARTFAAIGAVCGGILGGALGSRFAALAEAVGPQRMSARIAKGQILLVACSSVLVAFLVEICAVVNIYLLPWLVSKPVGGGGLGMGLGHAAAFAAGPIVILLWFHAFHTLALVAVAYGLFRRRRWARWVALGMSLETAMIAAITGCLFLQESHLYATDPGRLQFVVTFAIISLVSGIHTIMTHAFFWRRAVRAEFQ